MTAPQPDAAAELPQPESVRVVIQARPLLPFELAHNARRAVTIQSQPPTIHVARPLSSLVIASDKSGNDPTQFSCFDAVYDAAPGSAPDALYDHHVSPLVNTLFTGINATVFAYGQTCAGKSYTMRHITTRTAAHIFDHKRRLEAGGSVHVAVRVGFVEIYRESIRDLADGASAPLGAVHVHVRARVGRPASTNDGESSEKRSIFLDGARERCVDSEQALMDIVNEGALVRRTAATGMNASSSRSHSIITISILQEQLQSSTDDKASLYSKIHLVDLAGSERAKRTAAAGERFSEGVDINKGLFALAKVISTLADNARRPAARRAHVPYRDSKLTRLLQDSLGGSARTVLIACVSPADSSAEETLGTLRYAERARHIRNQPKVNKEPNAVEVSDLRAALSRARAKIAALAAENERMRSGGKCASCSSKFSARGLNANDECGLIANATGSAAAKTGPSSPSGAIRLAVPPLRVETTRIPKRAGTSLTLPTGQSSPQRVSNLTKLPKRAARVGTTRKIRSPSTGPNRRRSQSAIAMRARGRRTRLGDAEDMSISPSVRSNLRRKRMRPNNVQIVHGPTDDLGDSDSSSSGEEGEQDDDEVDGEEIATAKSLGRSAANVLTTTSMEEMRRTFTERLEQAETDKAALDAERNKLLQAAHEAKEKHQREIEQVKSEATARLNKLRSKLADVKRLEAESTRLNKLRDGSDAARKRLQNRVVAAEKSRDEMVSRLTDALSRTEVTKMNLSKENRVLVRSERQLRLELQRALEARTKLESALSRVRADNESMRARLVTNGSRVTASAATMRRVNSAFTPGLTHHEQSKTHRAAKGLRD